MPRYGWGRPPHELLQHLLNSHRHQYNNIIIGFLDYIDYYLEIPKYPCSENPDMPAWINGMLPGLDTVTLYGFIAKMKPKRYLEVGVGNSTRVVRHAALKHGSKTRITGIDPYPMAGIERVCDQLIQQPLENIDLGIFDELESGDILFIDNSHRIFMNSDATVVFLDIIPRLRPGVIVQFHDITLPVDYPPHCASRFYSEQYILAAYLLAGGSKLKVLLPNAFISLDSELSMLLDPLWLDERINSGVRYDPLSNIASKVAGQEGNFSDLVQTHGSSFWIQIN